MNIDKLAIELTQEEGKRNKPYLDTKGIPTIGVGRNLRDVGLFDDEINLMLKNDIQRSINDLDKYLPWWRKMDEVRQRVLCNLCFNMGIGNSKKGLLSFVNTLSYMMKGNYEAASQGMKNSKWYSDVGPNRGGKLVDMMRTGKDV